MEDVTLIELSEKAQELMDEFGVRPLGIPFGDRKPVGAKELISLKLVDVKEERTFGQVGHLTDLGLELHSFQNM